MTYFEHLKRRWQDDNEVERSKWRDAWSTKFGRKGCKGSIRAGSRVVLLVRFWYRRHPHTISMGRDLTVRYRSDGHFAMGKNAEFLFQCPAVCPYSLIMIYELNPITPD